MIEPAVGLAASDPDADHELSDQPGAGRKLLLVDDDAPLRRSLARALERRGFVVLPAEGLVDARMLARDHRPEFAVLDMRLAEGSGLELLRTLRELRPEIRIVMLTMHADADVVASAIRGGASGYLVKDCSTDEIADAVRMAAAGDTAVSPQLAASMLEEVRKLDQPAQTEDDRVITKREEEVLQLIADGLSTPEVADRLFISQKTVKNHLASIYQKLDARDRTLAVVQAVRMGIIHLD